MNFDIKNFEIIAFDLDDTLAESKTVLDDEMAGLLRELLAIKKVAVISGASFEQFEKQFLKNLFCDSEKMKNLFILPTNGASLFVSDMNGAWKQVYYHGLEEADKKSIFDAFEKTFRETNFEKPEKVYGILIEDRGAQVTFSGLGSEAPLSLKMDWDKDHLKRKKLVESLIKYLPDFSISIGGSTSIDITKNGIDKAFGLKKLLEYLNLDTKDMVYVGDALFPGGNDSSVFKLGVRTFSVADPGIEDTKKLIQNILTNYQHV